MRVFGDLNRENCEDLLEILADPTPPYLKLDCEKRIIWTRSKSASGSDHDIAIMLTDDDWEICKFHPQMSTEEMFAEFRFCVRMILLEAIYPNCPAGIKAAMQYSIDRGHFGIGDAFKITLRPEDEEEEPITFFGLVKGYTNDFGDDCLVFSIVTGENIVDTYNVIPFDIVSGVVKLERL